MKFLISSTLRIAAFALALPYLAQSAALEVNGLCVRGTCTAPGALTNGTSNSGTYNYNLTLVDGDSYRISVPYASSYSRLTGSTIMASPVVTYTGTSPSSTLDNISVDFFQNYRDTSPGTFDGDYTETVNLFVPTGDSATAQLFYDGEGIGLVGPLAPGYSVTQITTFLSGLTGNTLRAEYDFDFTFAAGSPTGSAFTSSAVPEPAQAIPAVLALASFALVAFRRRKN